MVSGTDQKGLVESLAAAVEELNGNWLESKLCRLEGHFAGIVSIDFPSGANELPSHVSGLSCHWKQIVSKEERASEAGQASIEILAADRPGIIKQISHVLTRHGANVEEVESSVSSAPFSGEQMFEARYRISFDLGTNEEHLQAGLEELAEELMCDLNYKQS